MGSSRFGRIGAGLRNDLSDYDGDSLRKPNMKGPNRSCGFASPVIDERLRKRRDPAIELIATVALAVSLVIAATAVSIGVARAQANGAIGHYRQHSALRSSS
jgi:hypothetical protein